MPTAAEKADRAAFDLQKPAVRAAVANLEAAIGGRQAMVDAFLAAPPDDEGYDLLLGAIADPRNDHKPLATLLDESGFTPGDLIKLYRSAAVARAQVLAIHEVAAEVPGVTRDVMRRAQNHYRLCEDCHGAGDAWEPVKDAAGKIIDRQKGPCKGCDGAGQILVDASLDHQKLALDLAGLLQKAGPATLVQVDASQHAAVQIHALPFAQLQKAVQKVLDPPTLPALPAPQPSARFDAPAVAVEAIEVPRDAV